MKTSFLLKIALTFSIISAVLALPVKGQDVPELITLHKSIRVLWHDAWPNKNYDLIKSTLPELESSVAELSKAKLPEMMHNRQSKWDSEIKSLQANLAGLKNSVAEDNKENMLSFTEAIHTSFENLVRVIRPKLAELDSFHEDLYKLYHNCMPANDLENIRSIIPSMKEKALKLQQAKLNGKLAEKQSLYDKKVAELQKALLVLEKSAGKGNTKKVTAAGENVHTIYQQLDALLQ